MEKTRPMKEEMDAKVFIFGQSTHFSFVNSIITVLLSIYTWTYKQFCFFLPRKKSKQEKLKYYYYYII